MTILLLWFTCAWCDQPWNNHTYTYKSTSAILWQAHPHPLHASVRARPEHTRCDKLHRKWERDGKPGSMFICGITIDHVTSAGIGVSADAGEK